jgi:hypothetical protein
MKIYALIKAGKIVSISFEEVPAHWTLGSFYSGTGATFAEAMESVMETSGIRVIVRDVAIRLVPYIRTFRMGDLGGTYTYQPQTDRDRLNVALSLILLPPAQTFFIQPGSEVVVAV